ncbi:amino acid ABC transporter ATP-binding/permease protein [Brevundimonas sp. FT23028]|uniref:amino acid ABC transporter ATP-binding/permease protein n=1 Tax=Brevundimonas sp. FT23028 TaxID=3393748 RepID=UPI003B5880AF
MKPHAHIRDLVLEQRRVQRDRLRLAAAAGALVSIAAVGLLGLSGWFLTGAALAGAAGAAAAQAFNYMMPSAIIRLLAILRTGARYIERVAGHEAALKALARLRPQLFDALAAGPVRQTLTLSSGELSARLVQDIDAIQTVFIRRSATWSLGAGLATAAVLATIASPLAGVALVAGVAVTGVGGLILARAVSAPAGRAAQTAVGALKSRLSALEAASPELKAYGLDDWAVQEVAGAAAASDRAQIALARAGGWMAAWQAAATALTLTGVVLAARSAEQPMIALAALAAVMGIESAAGLTGALHLNGRAEEALDRLDAALPAASIQHGRAPDGADLVLNTLDQRLTPPARIGLYGPSGAGKTSLIERLCGLRDALPDEAALGGVDLAEITPDLRRPLFAYAAQDVRLLDDSWRRNLLLAGPADEAALWAALEDAQLADRVRAEPQGLDAPVGPNGERLSGGERRRLGLARAFLRTAPWLVLDEPTEGLDAETEARVLAALDRRLAAGGQGLILVSHRLAPMRLCPLQVRVEGLEPDGRVRMTPDRLSSVA